jgi:branched-chain amino acid transport system ATP-binding protein
MPLLELQNVTKRFGGIQVINHISFAVEKGEIVSLIGPNGAGKTTLLNLITGLYQPDRGTITFDGQPLAGVAPHDITRLGIARTFQSLRLFLNMSVLENVMSAAFPRTCANLLQIVLRTPGFRREERRIREQAESKLAFFGERLVGYRFDQPAYSLSYANRRRLEIARAMMTEPKVLLLDEPAAGMNPNESLEVTELIGKLRDEVGYTIVFIEHDMSVVGGISDRVIALDHGEKIAEGTFEQVATEESVIEAYLGRKHASIGRPANNQQQNNAAAATA